MRTVTSKLLNLCPRPWRRALRPADHSPYRARSRPGPSVVFDCPGHRPKRAVHDEEIRAMIVTRKALPRRTVLRGLGASIALPLLDGMVPAFAALRNSGVRTMTPLTTRLGTIVGKSENDIQSFQGIPYAKPPVGERRFRAPEPHGPWSGTLDATRLGNRAMQPETPVSPRRRRHSVRTVCLWTSTPPQRTVAPAGVVLDSRRRLLHRFRQRPRRLRPCRPGRRGGGYSQLSARRVWLSRPVEVRRRPGRIRVQRFARPDPGTDLGAGQHRRLRW